MENWAAVSQQLQSAGGGGGGSSGRGKKGGGGSKQAKGNNAQDGPGPGERLVFRPLDWELDTPTPQLAHPASSSFDLVLACDCIYNESLVDAFVTTCVDICKLRRSASSSGPGGSTSSSSSHLEKGAGGGSGGRWRPTVVVVAQVLRNSDVFEAWIKRFIKDFRCWRVPDSLMIEGLKSEGGGGGGGGGGQGGTSGFVVHVGVLREGN